jgi:ferritin-like metal-binding protein YciE
MVMEKNKKKPATENSYQNGVTDEAHSKLRSFFVEEIKDIYWAEKQLVKALPKIQKAATNEELQNAFDNHLQQTKEHVTRLEQVFEILEEKAQVKKCEAMEGLIKESESIMQDTEAGSSTRDVGLIMAAQKVEHYEIATYGSLVQLADMLEMDRVVDILKITLDEEKQTDKKLTALAEAKVNRMSLEEADTQ